ncbi:F-box/kelch-repeat protein At1g80440-like [Musa acuminata AAA Group]|uniref:F-box/kelch-repeat protein At1g80440-like n=1 Tax=Musa acuminata AAA Group TaxID=214697 RepID=UPI0031D69D12
MDHHHVYSVVSIKFHLRVHGNVGRNDLRLPVSNYRRENGRRDGWRRSEIATSTPPPPLPFTPFDPVTGAWSCLPSASGLPHCLSLFCHLAAVAQQLVVIGRWDSETWAAFDRVHVYDFMSSTWRHGARMPRSRWSFACTTSKELRGGVRRQGHDDEKNALRSAIAYDVTADKWALLPDMARERDECRGDFRRQEVKKGIV